MKYIHRRNHGYIFKFNNKTSKFFSDKRYGGEENAKLAAVACRDMFLEHGTLLVPPNPEPTAKQVAERHGIPYRRFLQLRRKVGEEKAIDILTNLNEETQHELQNSAHSSV